MKKNHELSRRDMRKIMRTKPISQFELCPLSQNASEHAQFAGSASFVQTSGNKAMVAAILKAHRSWIFLTLFTKSSSNFAHFLCGTSALTKVTTIQTVFYIL